MSADDDDPVAAAGRRGDSRAVRRTTETTSGRCAARRRGSGSRCRWRSLLAAVLLVAAGFWGGATLQKRSGGSGSGGSALASAFAARLARRGRGDGGHGRDRGDGRGRGFGGFGGSTAAAIGTVSVVDGNTLYVLSATGSLVKVTLGPSTTITRNAKAPAVGLRPGDTVIVQGATGRERRCHRVVGLGDGTRSLGGRRLRRRAVRGRRDGGGYGWVGSEWIPRDF